MFVEVLENIRLQISAGADIHDFEQRRQRIVMINGVVTRNEHAKTSEQMLQTQVGAYALIKRIFVQDHANFFRWTNHSPKRRGIWPASAASCSSDSPTL